MEILIIILIFLFMIGGGISVYLFIKKSKNTDTNESQEEQQMKLKKEKFVPTTQDQLPIETIRGGIIKLKSGGYRALVELPSINIDLLEDEEKEGILLQYTSILSSIDFPFQYLQQSRIVDVSEYLSKIEKQKLQTNNEFVIKQLNQYSQFIVELIRESSVLTKKFYIIIPYDEKKERIMKGLKNKKNAEQTEEVNFANEEANMEKARKLLMQRARLIEGSFRRFGIMPHTLDDQELLDLFMTSYNKDRSVYQSVRGKDPADYTTLYVKRERGLS